MVRIVFDNGELIDCEHVNKIYIEESDFEEKLTVVGCIPEKEDDE